MYNILFYENAVGKTPLWDYMESLRVKINTDKSARIIFKQFSLYIQLLADNGFNLPDSIAKHLEDDIWELRPGKYRILFFFSHSDNAFILLHHFRKKTQKTPSRELTQAKHEQHNWLTRKETLQ